MENIDAVQPVKAPQTVVEVRSFLGLLTYHYKFMKNAFSLIASYTNFFGLGQSRNRAPDSTLHLARSKPC